MFLLNSSFCFVFKTKASSCSSGCTRTHSIDQAALQLRYPPTFVSAGIKGLCCYCLAEFFFYSVVCYPQDKTNCQQTYPTLLFVEPKASVIPSQPLYILASTQFLFTKN